MRPWPRSFWGRSSSWPGSGDTSMILNKLLGRRETLAQKTGPWLLADAPNLFGARASAAGNTVGPEQALSLSAVFAAANFLSRVLGALPLNVYRRKADGSKDVAANHRSQRLLHTQPNAEMTAVTFRRTLEFHRLLWGNAYAEVVWDGGSNAAALWPIEPWRVKPKREPDSTLYYEVDRTRRLYPQDMLHVRSEEHTSELQPHSFI